jgi:hypothetical protein
MMGSKEGSISSPQGLFKFKKAKRQNLQRFQNVMFNYRVSACYSKIPSIQYSPRQLCKQINRSKMKARKD